MPVGKVFNAAENQILFSPVTAVARGKANRLQQALGQAELDAIPGKNAAAARKEGREDAEAARKQADADRESSEFSAKSLYEYTTKYAEDYESDGEQVASDNLIETLRPIYDAMPDSPEKKIMGKYFEDNLIDKDEAGRIRSVAARHAGIEEEAGDRTAQKFIDKNGNSVQGSMDKDGKYYDSSGKQRTDITPIAPAATQSDLAGGAGDSDIAARKIREVMGATDNLIMSMDRISAIVKDAPQASLGLPGGVSAIVDQAINAAAGFGELAGGWAEVNGEKVNEKSLLDVRLYRDVFEGASATNAALQANAVGVSYALARAANPDGRISDADVRHQLKRLQLEQSSKTRIFAAMEEVKREALGSAMNWLRTSDATDTDEGKEAFSKYADALEKMDPTVDDDIYSRARAAIANGADPDAVKKRLAEAGKDPSKL